MGSSARFVDEDTHLDFSKVVATDGQVGYDVAGLLNKTGNVMIDPGFVNTASCESQITYIDGEQGVLRYRGYPIEQLADKSDYLETCFLLLEGHLPSAAEKIKFENIIRRHTMVSRSMESFFSGFRYDAHPMAMLCGAVGAMSSFYHDSLDITDPEHRAISAHRLIAKMPTLAAMCHKHFVGQPFIYPDNTLGYSENFLRMMFATPCEEYEVHPALAKAMDRIFLLHADHEQNASTSTVRLAGSSGANPFACIAAGIAALWGPAHGGANEAVLTMLAEIGHEDRCAEFVARAKDKNDPFRLMGFGHRVYKNTDPRAKVLKQSADEVLELLGVENNPLLQVAKELEQTALNDEYFIEKKLFPNVDFYSGIILEAMGFPTSMFTPIFALSRTVGWISQWKEQFSDPAHKIGRPRQLYLGETARDYTDIEDR